MIATINQAGDWTVAAGGIVMDSIERSKATSQPASQPYYTNHLHEKHLIDLEFVVGTTR